jgi:uncharacterized protein
MRFHSETIKENPMKKYIALLLVFTGLTGVWAQEIPAPMQPPRMVNDFSELLQPGERQNLEKKLQEFYYQTSTQIYIVILDNLDGYPIDQFSFLLGEQWGIGTGGKDNGILILVNPSADRKHGDVFIASGYGLEGAVPDAHANRIVDYDMVPRFKELDYYGGLDAAASTIIDLTRGEYTMDEYVQRNAGSSGPEGIITMIFFIIIVLSIFGRGRRRGQQSVGKNLPLWAALFMVSGAGRSHSGSFGNFSSGSGGFGGFGGGMGGGFGGGGAGGSW